MKKIKFISDLPEWFMCRNYRKQLSDIDWYREIRCRQSLFTLIEMHLHETKTISNESQSTLLNILTMDDVRSDALIFALPYTAIPISDITVSEVTYLYSSIRDTKVKELAQDFERLLALWCEVLKEDCDWRTPLFREYEGQLAAFIKHLDDTDVAKSFDGSIGEHDDLGNPFLSYGRALNGYPVTIDTQFDDETILQHVKTWLAEKREAENSSARRPFNQNDFDDWEYYKIREVFDLQAWAIITGVKITDSVISSSLWPNVIEGFSPIDVLRTTTKKKVREIFRYETVIRLYGQLVIKHGEKFFAK